MESKIKEFLKELTEFNLKKENLRIEEIFIYNKLKNLKSEIEKKNRYLLGEKAFCVNKSNPNTTNLCVCTGVRCLDDFSIQPLFSLNNKNYSCESYEWVNKQLNN